MALSQRQRLTIGLLVFYWSALFILTHIPIPQLIRKAGVSDVILHFVAYLILVFLLWFAVSPERKVIWRSATVWWVLLVVAGYGIVDELLQGCISGRTCDVRDFVANLVGILTGLILFSLLNFWPALLVTMGITIFTLTNVARADLTNLVPVTNAVFHFFAYGFFTVVWLRYIYLFLSPKPLEAKWIIIALLPPTAFLITVKLFSVVLGKEFVVQDVVISFVAIATTVFLVCLFGLVRRTHV